jgi:hypothetical protein
MQVSLSQCVELPMPIKLRVLAIPASRALAMVVGPVAKFVDHFRKEEMPEGRGVEVIRILIARGLMHASIVKLLAVSTAAACLLSFGPTWRARAQGAQDACWVQGDASGVGRRPSPLDSTSVALDGGTLKVCYGRPSRRGRPVMGQLVSYGVPWRLGANEATTIHVPFAARIAGTNVTPGWYSLYVILGEKQWSIVVNREAQRWGVPINDEVRAKDVGSGNVAVERLDKPVETLTITLQRKSNSAATMDVQWENARVLVPIERR